MPVIESLLVFAAVLQLRAEPAAPPPVRVVAIDLARHPGFDWRAAGVEVYGAPRGGELRALADDAELARLAELGVLYTVVHEDLAAFYRSRLEPGQPAAAGSLGAWL